MKRSLKSELLLAYELARYGFLCVQQLVGPKLALEAFAVPKRVMEVMEIRLRLCLPSALGS